MKNQIRQILKIVTPVGEAKNCYELNTID